MQRIKSDGYTYQSYNLLQMLVFCSFASIVSILPFILESLWRCLL